MTPEKKANELVDKMYEVDDIYSYGEVSRYVAKQCALICVDEIIQTDPMIQWGGIGYAPNDDFWQEVKTEIEKL